MKKATFQRCLRAVDSMTTLQGHDLKVAIERRDKLVGNPTVCPHCHRPEIRPWGQGAGLPRFRCRGCHRTFSAWTKMPLAGLHHKDRWMYSWRNSARRNRSGRRPGGAGSIRKPAYSGDTGFWLCLFESPAGKRDCRNR